MIAVVDFTAVYLGDPDDFCERLKMTLAASNSSLGEVVMAMLEPLPNGVS